MRRRDVRLVTGCLSEDEMKIHRERMKTEKPVSTDETVRHKASRQEEEIAAMTGGRVKPGSGSSALSKGDVSTKVQIEDLGITGFLIEAKHTIHKQIILKGEWLSKISEEAHHEGKCPAVAIRIAMDDPLCEQDWYIIPGTLFEKLHQKA